MKAKTIYRLKVVALIAGVLAAGLVLYKLLLAFMWLCCAVGMTM